MTNYAAVKQEEDSTQIDYLPKYSFELTRQQTILQNVIQLSVLDAAAGIQLEIEEKGKETDIFPSLNKAIERLLKITNIPVQPHHIIQRDMMQKYVEKCQAEDFPYVDEYMKGHQQRVGSHGTTAVGWPSSRGKLTDGQFPHEPSGTGRRTSCI